MKFSLRNHIFVFIISIVISFLVYFDCYADEIVDLPESEVLEDVPAQSESVESDFIPDLSGQSLSNLYVENLIISTPEVEISEEEEEEIYILSPSESFSSRSLPIIPRDNTLLYFGSFDNRDCWALFPQSASDSLCSIDGVLVNLGSSNITGRIFYADAFDLTDFQLSFIVLSSQFSTGTANTVYTYSYPSYVRYYYSNGQRLVNSDSYGFFYVSDIVPTFDTSREQKQYYIILIICLFVGSGFIFSRLSRR